MQNLLGNSKTLIGHTRYRLVPGVRPARAEPAFWSQHREAALNWLALGLLLAAWNAADNDSGECRPTALKGYETVSVRAAARFGAAT